MTSAERWLDAMWPLVRGELPAPPARVLDLGCGPLGGFVPMLLADGYDPLGVDPKAPPEAHYQRVEFERCELPHPLDAIVASTALHHVSDPADVIDRIAAALTVGGTLVVLEWAWERFDGETADWCFARLRPDRDPGWLHRRRDEWLASGLAWPTYLRGWTEREGVHQSEELVRLLDERLERRRVADGPYVFADLAGVTADDEQAAIDAGAIRATRIDWVGLRRDRLDD
jgi:SAM-dependent methyltransferase